MYSVPQWARSLAIRVVGAECTTELLDKANYQHLPCVKLAVSKCLSLGIITGAMVVKVPQIVKIILSRSTQGLSGLSYLLETLAASITFGYNLRARNPFSTYGETFFMVLQNLVIMVLLGLYRRQMMRTVLLLSIYSVFMSSLLIPAYFTDATVRSLQALTIPLNMLSRLPQILIIWRHRGTGQLSALTVFLVWAGSMARVYTSFQETAKDRLLLLSFGLAALLNSVILVQLLYYWREPAEPKQKTKAA